MINIEYKKKIGKELDDFIGREFDKYAIQNGVTCNYRSFYFVATEDNKVIGIITGHTYYQEVHISDLIILVEYRKKHLGTKLAQAVEEYYKDKGFENINLTTYGFQAPEFYKKCGFQVEFIRENKNNPKLTKYFLVKYY